VARLATYLADTSALARLRRPAVAAQLVPLVEAGLVATCAVIDLEVAWSTRTAEEFDRLRADRETGYERLETHDDDWRRAFDVQSELWRNGKVRAVGFPDLLIAAVAEREQVTILHYDSDFDMIAEATGQPTRWIVPRGSVP